MKKSLPFNLTLNKYIYNSNTLPPSPHLYFILLCPPPEKKLSFFYFKLEIEVNLTI